MVGATGLEPVKAVRPGDLQSPAIAAMRYSHKTDEFADFTHSSPVNHHPTYISVLVG